MGVSRIGHWGCRGITLCYSAILLQLMLMALPVCAETVPSLPPPATVQTTGGWWYSTGCYPASSFPGYPTGQAFCATMAAEYNKTNNSNYTIYFQGTTYGGMCLRVNCCGTVDILAWPTYVQCCPSGYQSPNAGFTPYPETCVKVSAANQCPAVAAGETPYTLDPSGQTCSRPDQCLPPNTINPNTGLCEPVNLTITLSGGTTTEPSTLLPFNAIVKNQNGAVQAGKQVTITVTVQGGTGGHIHNENRPKGSFTCSSALAASPESCTLTTDSGGQAPFEFIATPISGTHTITATCSGCGNTETKSVDVKVNGLIPIPDSSKYALQDSTGAVIGAVTNKHIANHYLTSASIGKLNDFALKYNTSNLGAKLYLNDASLEWGGLFDVGSAPWMSPHNGHNRGTSVDIRAANSGVNNQGAVPATAFAKTSKNAADAKAKAALHCTDNGILRIGAPCNGIPNNRHFHVDF